MGPYGRENFKELPLLQLCFFFNQTFSECSPIAVLTKFGYRNFENLNLFYKKRLKCNILANGKILKPYSFHSYDAFSNIFFLWTFPVTGLTQKLLIGILEVQFKEKEKIKISLIWDPMGCKFSKGYSSYSYDSFSTKLFLNFPCDSPHKLSIEIFKLHFFKKISGVVLICIGIEYHWPLSV